MNAKSEKRLAFDVALGEQIRELRRTKGMSQGDVAKRLGMPRVTVSKWEHGAAPSLFATIRIARALNVPFAELVAPAWRAVVAKMEQAES